MHCFIAGVEFDIRRVIYRDHGYGTNPGKPLVDFEICISPEELLSSFSEPFADFIRQCAEDDELAAEPDIPELHRLGYPSLSEMLFKYGSVLSELIRDYLYFKVLDALFSMNPREGWEFAINEIANVELASDKCVFRGVGYYLL